MRAAYIIAISLSLSIAFAQRSRDQAFKDLQDYPEESEREDPGILVHRMDQRPGNKMDKDKDTDLDNGRPSDVASFAGSLAGGLSALFGLCAFLGRLYQRWRQIRDAGEGMGRLYYDLLVALLTIFHRRRNIPAIDC